MVLPSKDEQLLGRALIENHLLYVSVGVRVSKTTCRIVQRTNETFERNDHFTHEQYHTQFHTENIKTCMLSIFYVFFRENTDSRGETDFVLKR